MTFNNVLHTCANKDLNFDLYEDRFSEETKVDLDSVRVEEVAFQEVLQVIPLQGNEDDPAPSLAIVIKGGDPEIPEVMAPTPISVKEMLATLPSKVYRAYFGPHTENALITTFVIKGDYPEPPVLWMDVAESVITVAVPTGDIDT